MMNFVFLKVDFKILNCGNVFCASILVSIRYNTSRVFITKENESFSYLDGVLKLSETYDYIFSMVLYVNHYTHDNSGVKRPISKVLNTMFERMQKQITFL